LRQPFLLIEFYQLVLFSGLVDHKVNKNTEYKSASNAGNGNLAEGKGKTADTCNKNYRNCKEVGIVLEINVLYHLKSGDCDKSIKSHTNATHYARGDGVNECNEGSKEGDCNSSYCCGENGNDRSISGNSNTTNGLTVGGIGASSEDSACHRSYTVTEKGSVKTGIFEKVGFNDRRNVLVVSKMLCEYNECNGNVCCKKGKDVRTGEFTKALECGYERKVGNGDEGVESYSSVNECLERAEIDNLKCINARNDSDNGKDRSNGVSRKDSHNEGDEANHFFAVNRADDGNGEGNKTAYDRYLTVSARRGLLKITDCVAGERKTYNSNRRADNCGRHQLIDPLNACKLNYKRDDHVNETCENSTDDKSEITQSHRNTARECSSHRTDERKGRAEEHGALKFCEEKVDDSTDAGTEESRNRAHFISRVACYDNRNDESSSHNCEELLDSKDDYLRKLRFVLDTVDEFHKESSIYEIIFCVDPVEKTKFDKLHTKTLHHIFNSL